MLWEIRSRTVERHGDLAVPPAAHPAEPFESILETESQQSLHFTKIYDTKPSTRHTKVGALFVAQRTASQTDPSIHQVLIR